METSSSNYLLKSKGKVISEHTTLGNIVKDILDRYPNKNITEFTMIDDAITLSYADDKYIDYEVYFTVQKVKVPVLV